MEHYWTFFSFPLNVLLAVLWMSAWGWLFKYRPENPAVRFLLSPAATISALGFLLLASLWLGLGGSHALTQSIGFVLILLYIQTVLFLITLRGWRRAADGIRWRFLLIHCGLALALGSGFWGSPDSYEMRLQLMRGESASEAYMTNGSRKGTGYEIKLVDFHTEYSETGKPVHYEAVISVDSGQEVSLTVNHPFSPRFGEDIYLTSVSEDACILAVVREPWRYFTLAGIIMLIAGAFMMFIKGARR